MIAIAGTGVTALGFTGHLTANGLKALFSACERARQAWRRRATADYQSGRTVVIDGWILSDTENELLEHAQGDSTDSTSGSNCI